MLVSKLAMKANDPSKLFSAVKSISLLHKQALVPGWGSSSNEPLAAAADSMDPL